MDTALASFRHAAQLNPDSSELVRLLALVYRARGDSAQSLEALTKVRDSGNPEVLFDLSVQLEEQGRHQEGADAAAQAAKLFHDQGARNREAAAYWQLGWCAYSLSDLPRSAEASQKAVELDPSLFPAHFNLGLAMLLQGDANEARQHYEAGMKAVQEPSDIKYYAILDLEAAARKHPDNPAFAPILVTLKRKHAAMTQDMQTPTQTSAR